MRRGRIRSPSAARTSRNSRGFLPASILRRRRRVGSVHHAVRHGRRFQYAGEPPGDAVAVTVRAGRAVVIAAGVNVLAHTVPREAGYTEEELAAFKVQGTALIPTLSLFAKSPLGAALAARMAESAVSELKAFSDNGGTVLFGTDVGFTEIYDTSLEYELMHRALSERQVLASLTTNPALYFKAAKKGRVEQGFDADLDHKNYYLAHETIVRRVKDSSMGPFSFAIFSFLNRVASRAPDFFKIPHDAVIEVGFRVMI